MNTKCPDCGVEIGKFHKGHCDWETCAECGTQRLRCTCNSAELIAWAGKKPIEITAKENGWFTFWDPNGAGKPEENYGWVPCHESHPKAQLDLNRVYRECKWNKATKRWAKE